MPPTCPQNPYTGHQHRNIKDVKDQGRNQQGQAMVQVIFNELYEVTA